MGRRMYTLPACLSSPNDVQHVRPAAKSEHNLPWRVVRAYAKMDHEFKRLRRFEPVVEIQRPALGAVVDVVRHTPKQRLKALRVVPAGVPMFAELQ
jgi:hypothetical protein